ncbi:MAG: hypothetical protein ABIJ39_01680 [Chloroflexota bacterium]
MPRIRCHYGDCIFIDDGYCSAAQVEIDPDTGCATYAPNEEGLPDKNAWDEELEEWEDEDADEDDETWMDDDEESL